MGAAALVAAAGLAIWLQSHAADTAAVRAARLPHQTVLIEIIAPPVTPPPELPVTQVDELPPPQPPGEGAEATPPEAPPPGTGQAETPPETAPPVAETPPVAVPPPVAAQAPPNPAPAGNAPNAAVKLAPAPAPALTEATNAGPLPRVGSDGVRPWRYYARPFDLSDTRPRIAIIVGDLGLSHTATDLAIQRLPGAVTLLFAPYAHDVDGWLAKARAAGHESLMALPMEPDSYPQDDPGPNALMTTVDDDQNANRLALVLSRGAGYVGLAGFMGSRFAGARERLKPVLAELARRGLIYVDTVPGSVVAQLAGELGLPQIAVDRVIDRLAAGPALDTELAALEATARARGWAVGLASPYPVTLDKLEAWSRGLAARGLVLAPVSAVQLRANAGG